MKNLNNSLFRLVVGMLLFLITLPSLFAVDGPPNFPSDMNPSTNLWVSGIVYNSNNVDAGTGSPTLRDVILYLNGVTAQTNSAYTGNLGGNFNWAFTNDTSSLANGTNWIVVYATNNSALNASNTYIRLVDNLAPIVSTTVPSGWNSTNLIISGEITNTNSGIKRLITLKIGKDFSSALTYSVTNQSNAARFTFSTNFANKVFTNATNFVWTIVSNGASPSVVTTNSNMLLIDNSNSVLTTSVSNTGWVSSSFLFSGTTPQTNSGVSGNLLVNLGGQQYVVTNTDNGTNYSFSRNLPVTGLSLGSNVLEIIMSNGAAVPIVSFTTNIVYFDNQSPISTNLLPLSWVGGSVVMTNRILFTNSSTNVPLFIQIGSDLSTTNTYLLTKPTRVGASNLYIFTNNTSSLSSGTNFVWTTVSNGASLAVVSNFSNILLVDNLPPQVSLTFPNYWVGSNFTATGKIAFTNSGIVGPIQIRIGSDINTAYTNLVTSWVTNGNSCDFSSNISTTNFANGSNLVWVIVGNGATPPLLSTNTSFLLVDTTAPVIVSSSSNSGWMGSNFTFYGNIPKTNSGLSVNPILILTNKTFSNNYAITPILDAMGTNYTFSVDILSSTMTPGSNFALIIASNSASNSVATTSNFSVLFDNQPPVLSFSTPSTWVKSNMTLTNFIINSNSSTSCPVVILIGTNFSTATSYVSTPLFTGTASNRYTNTWNTTNFPNGSNYVWMIASNGASPSVVSTNSNLLLVDNERPGVISCVVANVTPTKAHFDISATDNNKSGILSFIFKDINSAATATVTSATNISYDLTGTFGKNSQAWTVVVRDNLANDSLPITNLFEYNFVSNISPTPTTSNQLISQNSSFQITFKEQLNPSVIYDTRNFFISTQTTNYSSNYLIPSVTAISPDQYTITVTPVNDMGQGGFRYLNIATNVTAAATGNHLATNRFYQFKTKDVLTVTNTVPDFNKLAVKPLLTISFGSEVIASTVNEQSLWFYMATNSNVQIRYTITKQSETNFTLQLDEALIPQVGYQLLVSTNIRATNGSTLGNNTVWNFTTSPSFGYTGLSPQNTKVPLNAQPSIKFLTNILASSINTPSNQMNLYSKSDQGVLALISGTVQLTGGSTVVYVPATNLLVNSTYLVSVGGEIRSLESNYFGQTVTWEFTTGDPVAPPLSVYPEAGQSNVRLGTQVLVSFTNTKALDSSTVTAENFYLYITNDGSGSPVKIPATTQVQDSTNLVLKPSIALEPSVNYICVVTTGVRWIDANSMDSNRSWTFRTTDPLAYPKTLVPLAGANFVAPGTPISATFPENLRSDTLTGSIQVVEDVTGTPVQGTVSFASNSVTFTPKESLISTKRYRATVLQSILSANDAPYPGVISWTFTIGSYIGIAGGSVTNSDGTIILTFPRHALDKDTLIQIDQKESSTAEQSTLSGAKFFQGTSFEIGPSETSFLKPISGSFFFGRTAAAGQANLSIFRYENNGWKLLGGTKNDDQIAFTIREPGRYSLVQGGTGSGDEAAIACYPRVASINEGMSISFGLSQAKSGRVRIYSISGIQVRDLTPVRQLNPGDNTFFWNCRTDDGRAVTPGIYVVVVEDSSFARIFQKVFSVIR